MHSNCCRRRITRNDREHKRDSCLPVGDVDGVGRLLRGDVSIELGGEFRGEIIELTSGGEFWSTGERDWVPDANDCA